MDWVEASRAAHPDWHSRPVAASGPADAPILVVGLAPGLRGANRTGLPFVGDRSGEWLHRALAEVGLVARITNVVKCCPPQNRPTTEEIRTCRAAWLDQELATGPRVIVALGAVAHAAVVDGAFAHGTRHTRPDGRVVFDSYHPSPLNTQTGRLRWPEFLAVFVEAGRVAGSRAIAC